MIVRTLTGKNIIIELDGWDTLADLKRAIQEKEGIPLDQQRIIFRKGQLSSDDLPLEEYGVDETSTLHLLLRLRGGEGIGFSVGGSKDVASFRKKVMAGGTLSPDDLTFEGLFNEYYFDANSDSVTSPPPSSDHIFAPTFSFACDKGPTQDHIEHWMTVGLDSNISGKFSRLPLNLIIVLDISGSMDSSFATENAQTSQTKLTVAKEVVEFILNDLSEQDRVGIVVFHSDAKRLVEIKQLTSQHKNLVLKEVFNLETAGATNMEAAIRIATKEFETILKKSNFDFSQTENRIVFLTDDHPNTGDTTPDGLKQLLSEAEQKLHVHITFVGLGIDFDPKTVEQITKIRGSNYCSVKSPQEFKKRVAEEFKFLVCPLYFDLAMKLNSSAWKISEIYGSPDSIPEQSQIMHVKTLFPAPKDESGRIKGGVILLKLKRNSQVENLDGGMGIDITFTDRKGAQHDIRTRVEIPEKFRLAEEYHGNLAIRKAIVLTRYFHLLKAWLAAVSVRPQEGQLSKFPVEPFQRMCDYISQEKFNLKEDQLEREIQILNSIMMRLKFQEILSKFHHERQVANTNTCFQHAFNMLFYPGFSSPANLKIYAQLVRKFQVEIQRIVQDEAIVSFYGSEKIPKLNLKPNSSNPLEDEDLHGYYQIYSAFQVEDFLKAIVNENCIELSPFHALFLMQFQLEKRVAAGTQVESHVLVYKPHRFYHRCARSELPDAQEELERWQILLNQVDQVFFARVETNKSHAFGAKKWDGKYWAVLDSLLSQIRSVGSSAELIKRRGRLASVMIIPDPSRGTIVFGN
eukprot:TRINITY_DN2474_c0_g1_i1.p1 TRINITY_DN2474_c0_g1~~TRINITY_DN2474_c0_g1_i1.p1  ORF type:complete len:800 (-),score=288.08 TRINITY_DN2474_c0_g1_i1:95-2494(-)